MFRTLIATLIVALTAHLTLLSGALHAQTFRPAGAPAGRPIVYPTPVGGRPISPAFRPTTPFGRPTPPPPGLVLRPQPIPGRPVPSLTKYPGMVRAVGGVSVPTHSYATQHGTRLGNGRIVYRGLNHQQWTRKAFSPRWRCWVWFCPSANAWYYWAPSRALYLPVAYLPVVAPDTADPGTGDPASIGEQPPGSSEIPVEEGDLNLPEPPA